MSNLPVPSLAAPVVGNPLSQSYLTNQLYNPLTFLLNPPLFFGIQASGSEAFAATNVAVTIDTGVIDTYNGHSNTTNNSRYTGPVPGYYEVSGCVSWVPNSSGQREAKVRKNGADVQGAAVQVNASASGLTTISTPVVYVFMNGTTDYVEIWQWNNVSGGTSSSAAGDQACSMSVRWVHA